METAEIRRRWLRFFEERGHTVVPSAPLLLDDPTLLFVNAGMVPFKPYFLGQEQPPWARATSVQKCVRTLDIEEVGKTTRHGTFFQMNGNFSFGDYFKEGAIELAWELLTRPIADGGYGMSEDRLWATTYLDDDEAIGYWKKVAGLPDERIVRRGLKDNYWHMGVPGPGGPCSEIYYDRGPDYGKEGGPEADEDRYLEVWNLVFMQELLGQVRSKVDFDVLGELPAKNIDTGMGLERMATVLQGVESLYDIDETFPVIARAADLAGRRYGDDHIVDVRLRVVGDHVRTALMIIGDGVTPSNEARGYVLRRLIRRAVRSMRLLGVDRPVLPELLPVSKELMARSYPELETGWERISSIAYAEEEAFLRTLSSGTTILDTAVQAAQSAGLDTLPGDQAFRLHDTYGFPFDLTVEAAAEQGLAVDVEGFRRLMNEQRERAKADARAKKSGHADVSAYREIVDAAGPTEFTGYDELTTEGRVSGLLVDGLPAKSAVVGQQVELVLDRTPFYAEGGGQLADAGIVRLSNGALVEVDDVQTPVTGLIVHRARVLDGEVEIGDLGLGVVDVERRRSISRAHTATHLVHKAFREALGETATQAGSENAPGRFRFDFSAGGPVPPSVLRDVEQRVNEVLVDDLDVRAEVMSQEEARAIGAMALFGEKYGDRVRVVSVGDWARELCGGTHASRSGQLGVIKLLHESSIGAGVRRVEALVGVDAYRFLAREHVLLAQLSEALKARPEELPERVEGILTRLKEAERDIAKMRAEQLKADAAAVVGSGEQVGDATLVAFRAPDGVTGNELRELVLSARGSAAGAGRPVVAVGLGVADGKVAAVAATDDRARSAGLSAKDALAAALAAVGGRGGGKDDVAQGGGTDPAGIDAALAAVKAWLAQA